MKYIVFYHDSDIKKILSYPVEAETKDAAVSLVMTNICHGYNTEGWTAFSIDELNAMIAELRLLNPTPEFRT